MADDQGTGFLDILKNLSGGQIAQIAGATLGGLNFGSPRNPFRPLQGVGALGEIVEAQRQLQRRRTAVGPLVESMPEDVKALMGMFAEQGDLGSIGRFKLQQQADARGQAADLATPDVFNAGPTQDAEMFPGTPPPTLSDLPTEEPEVVRPGTPPITLPFTPSPTASSVRAGLERIPNLTTRADVSKGINFSNLPTTDPAQARMQQIRNLARLLVSRGMAPQAALMQAAAQIDNKGALPPPRFVMTKQGEVAIDPLTVEMGKVVPNTAPGPTYSHSGGMQFKTAFGQEPVATPIPGYREDREKAEDRRDARQQKAIDAAAERQQKSLAGIIAREDRPKTTTRTSTRPLKAGTPEIKPVTDAVRDASAAVESKILKAPETFTTPGGGVGTRQGLITRSKETIEAQLAEAGYKVKVRWDGRRFVVGSASEIVESESEQRR